MTQVAPLILGEDGRPRCGWAGHHADYVDYHDHEWGFPVVDERRLFEKICLEGFQAGLSWLTILRKRAHFRRVFKDFDDVRVKAFGAAEKQALLQDAGIIRHAGKINATINNAAQSIALRAEFGSLAQYFWQYEAEPAPPPRTLAALPGQTALSQKLSKDLKRRGWSFVGPTTCYAFMQAMGLVNDHLQGCFVRERVADARATFNKPAPK